MKRLCGLGGYPPNAGASTKPAASYSLLAAANIGAVPVSRLICRSPRKRAWAIKRSRLPFRPMRLEPALKLLQGRSVPAVGVVDWDGKLVGYITSENVGELMLLESAGRGRTPRRAAGPLLPQ